MTASLSDLCSTSSDDDNANGKIHAARKRPNSLVEESTDLSSESEDEESDLSESLAAFFASDSEAHHLMHYKKGAKVLIIRKILTCNMYHA